MANFNVKTSKQSKVKFNLLQLISSRQTSLSQHCLQEKNRAILKTLVSNEENGSTVSSVATFQGDKSCGRIIVSDGHLIVIHTGSPTNIIEIYNLNSPLTKKGFKKISLPIDYKLKDEFLGICPVYDKGNKVSKNCYRTGLYFISSRQLHVLNIEKGTIESVPLPEGNKFNNLTNDKETNRLVATSYRHPVSDTLIIFAIYEYYPCLKFDQILKIKTSVYGDTLLAADITNGFLLTFHEGNKIKGYSLDAVCGKKNCAPPVILELDTFEHVLAIGATPYYVVLAMEYNKFSIRLLAGEDPLPFCGHVTGNAESYDSTLRFHPDKSSRLIFTDNGMISVFDIIHMDESSSLVPTKVYSLFEHSSERFMNSYDMIPDMMFIKPISSTVYCRTSQEEDMVHVSYDYQEDLDILGVLFAHQNDGYDPHLELTLDLIDSTSGQRIRRIELKPDILLDSLEAIEVFLRLDADRCIISIARSNHVIISVLNLVSLNQNGSDN